MIYIRTNYKYYYLEIEIKITEEYLNKLNESGAAMIAGLTILKLIFAVLIRLVFKSQTKKREHELENKLYMVTKKRYNVFSLKDDAPQAYVIEWFKNNIYITTGLMKIMNEREIMAIMIHETSHVINRDVVKKVSVEFGGSVFLTALFASLESLAFKSKNPVIAIGSLSVSFLAASILMTLMMTQSTKWYKRQETAADVSVVKYGYAKDLISALNKIEKYKKKQYKDFAKKNPDVDLEKLDKGLKQLEDHPEHKDRVKRLLEEEKLYVAMVNGNLVEVKNIIKSYLIVA